MKFCLFFFSFFKWFSDRKHASFHVFCLPAPPFIRPKSFQTEPWRNLLWLYCWRSINIFTFNISNLNYAALLWMHKPLILAILEVLTSGAFLTQEFWIFANFRLEILNKLSIIMIEISFCGNHKSEPADGAKTFQLVDFEKSKIEIRSSSQYLHYRSASNQQANWIVGTYVEINKWIRPDPSHHWYWTVKWISGEPQSPRKQAASWQKLLEREAKCSVKLLRNGYINSIKQPSLPIHNLAQETTSCSS